MEPWDPANLDRDCFGGKYSVEGADALGKPGTQEFDRPNSAYMLFYERSDELEPVERLDEALARPSETPGPVDTTGEAQVGVSLLEKGLRLVKFALSSPPALLGGRGGWSSSIS